MAARPLPLLPSSPAPVVAGAVGLAALVGVGMAQDVTIGLGLMAALVYVPLAFISLPLAFAGWLVLFFLAGLPGFEAAANPLLLLSLLAWLGLASRRGTALRAALREQRRWLLAVGALVLWITLSLAWAPVFDDGWFVTKDMYFDFIVVLVVLGAFVLPDHLRWLALAFIGGAVLSVLVGAAQGGLTTAATDATTSVSHEGRLTGGAGDANELAAALVPGIMLALGLAARPSPLLRALLAVAVAIMAVGLVATQSRGGMLAIVVALLAGLVVWKGRRKLILALTLGLAFVAACWFTLSPAAWDRITQSEDRGSGREDIWQVAYRIGEDHPVVGVGISQFPNVSPDYVRLPGELDVTHIVDQRIVVHNLYLSLWTELGIVGFLLGVGVILASLAASWKAAQRFDLLGDAELASFARAAFVALLGALAASFFLSSLADRRLWVLLALGPALLGIAARRLGRQRRAAGELGLVT